MRAFVRTGRNAGFDRRFNVGANGAHLHTSQGAEVGGTGGGRRRGGEVRKSAQINALQVAARRRNRQFRQLLTVFAIFRRFGGIGDFLEDRGAERVDHFRAREDVFARRDAEFGVGQVAQRRRRENAVQERGLPSQNRAVNVRVVTIRNFGTPVIPTVRSEVVEHIVRDLVRVDAERFLAEEFHRFALFRRRSNDERRAGVGVAFEVAVDRDAADEARRERQTVVFSTTSAY